MSGERGGLFEPATLRIAANLVGALIVFLVASVVRSPTLKPDLATLIVVFLALEQELVVGLALAAATGYLSDLFSGLGPGLDAFTNVVVYLVLRLFVARIAGGRFLMVTTLGLLSTALALVVRQAVEATIGPGQASLLNLLPAVPSVIAGAILLSYPIYLVFLVVDVRFRPREDYGFGGGRRGGLGA